jgi:glycosyltransferase involved in cell wall biosynthesis
VQEAAGKNVFFCGFVSDGDLVRLQHNACCVLALTTVRDTMQRAGYEALSVGTPVVASDFAVLRDYFGEAGIYTDNTALSIAAAVTETARRGAELKELLGQLRDTRTAEHLAGCERLRHWCEDGILPPD